MDIFKGKTVFSENKEVYDRFINSTTPHSKGYFILAPSGAGKTHYVKNQIEKNWIDGDSLWYSAGAHPDGPWWTMGIDVINEVDARSDIITQEAKKVGLWIIGASNNWLIPDAVVLPPREVNVEYIKKRENGEYDGGLKSDQLEQLDSHREWIRSMAEKNNVPIFDSVSEATDYIMKIYSNNN